MRRSTLICSMVGLLAIGSANVLAQGNGGRGGPGGGGQGGPGGPGGPGGRGFMMSPLMTALDTDGDGELSEKEIEAAPAKLKTLDKDKDGKLSAEELRPAGGPGGPGGFGGRGGMGGGTQMVTTIMAFDKDGDGKVSKAELPERLQAMMTNADTNKDGFLDKAELTKFAESRAAGAGGRGGPGGGRGGRPGGGDGGGGRDRDN